MRKAIANLFKRQPALMGFTITTMSSGELAVDNIATFPLDVNCYEFENVFDDIGVTIAGIVGRNEATEQQLAGRTYARSKH